VARSQRKTLNDAFREWLEQYTGPAGAALEFGAIMRRMRLSVPAAASPGPI